MRGGADWGRVFETRSVLINEKIGSTVKEKRLGTVAVGQSFVQGVSSFLPPRLVLKRRKKRKSHYDRRRIEIC